MILDAISANWSNEKEKMEIYSEKSPTNKVNYWKAAPYVEQFKPLKTQSTNADKKCLSMHKTLVEPKLQRKQEERKNFLNKFLPSEV